MRFVKVEQVKQGDILARDLFDNEFRLLVTQGKVLSNSYINKIKNMGITGVFIEDEVSKNIDVISIVPDVLKFNLVRNIKDFNFEQMYENAKSLVDYIINAGHNCNEFINMKTFDNYTYEHSVSVAVYAVMLGNQLGYSIDELVNLAMAGLLHDIGKLFISKDILYKPGRLTDDEFKEIKTHTTLGYKQIKDYSTISATIKTGIYQHHENEDGTGYPLGVKGDKIYRFAKIIHIVDVYDALISKRPYKEEKSSAVALKFLMDNAGSMFNEEYVDEFLKIIPGYPKGTTVMLSDGSMGIVAENRFGKTFRPVVKKLTGEFVDLSKQENEDLEIIE